MTNESQVSLGPFGRYEELLREWLIESGGRRIDVYCNSIHLTSEVGYWLTDQQGRKYSVRSPREVKFALHDIRPSQVDPVRGAWLWSHLWMEAADGVLHQEGGWMREPIIGYRPCSDKDAAFEFGSVSSGSAVGSGVDGGQGGCLSQGGGEVGASG